MVVTTIIIIFISLVLLLSFGYFIYYLIFNNKVKKLNCPTCGRELKVIQKTIKCPHCKSKLFEHENGELMLRN
ncbi:hypothetical protein HYI36_18575 [Bacillus sp. Gen3]|nr:hypothetical protein [Bacillus sp. Gen3]